jgi:hypothetical protein
MKKLAISLVSSCIVTPLAFAANPAPTWKKLTLSSEFHSEGAAIGDFNADGKMDVVSGPYWYEGPDFTKRHQIYTPTGSHDGAYKADGEYSDNFFAFTYDFNRDGYADYLVYGFPGADARIYMNPGKNGGEWKVQIVFDVVDNESPEFADITGDGKPDGIFHSAQTLGYATIDWADPLKKWTYHPISPKGGWQRFTHGYGFGDVNGDGRMDILESRDWWEQPADAGKEWIRHPYNFTANNRKGENFGGGGAQMHVYDVDGDGLNDVVSSLQAHGCGLAWFKQIKKDNGEITFEPKTILSTNYDEKEPTGVQFAQLHAVALVDMNGDGLKDIVTGKRFYAHHAHGDVAPQDPAVIYWFELKRDKEKGVQWIPHLIDDNSGVGTQLTVGNINNDGTPDIVIGNKKGTFVFVSQGPATASR